MIIKLKTNFQDKRGKILDIYVKSPKDHCSIVTFNKGAIRGNHYHRKSDQFTFIINGKLLLSSQKIKKNGMLIGKKKEEILTKNCFVIHKKFHAHAFKALEKSCILAFANGSRGGKNYDKDTWRLKLPLLK